MGYGYQIYKEYLKVFGKVLLRTFYYNLKKGVSTGEFVILGSKKESGSFTWGDAVERIYYTIGPLYELPNLSRIEMEKLSSIKQIKIEDNPKEMREKYKKWIEKKLEFAIEKKDIKTAKQMEKILDKINSWPPTPLFRVEREF